MFSFVRTENKSKTLNSYKENIHSYMLLFKILELILIIIRVKRVGMFCTFQSNIKRLQELLLDMGGNNEQSMAFYSEEKIKNFIEYAHMNTVIFLSQYYAEYPHFPLGKYAIFFP